MARGKRGAFYNTLEEFHKYWDRIDVITPRITNYELRITNQFGNVFVHPSPLPLILQPLWITKRGLELHRKNKFDLMTVHEYPPFYNGIGARLLWNKIKVPYILEIHHIPGYPRSGNLKEELYKSFLKVLIEWDSSKALAVRVVNQSQVPKFLNSSGVPKEKIIYIPSIYVDFDIFKPLNLAKEYDLIFVGRLEKNKGVDLLLEAASKLKVKSEKLKILVVGEGPLLENLKFKVKSLKLENNVIFHGWAKDQKEIAELLNKSKILLMPSYNEGGPRVVFEAMACGVPVIATPVGLAKDIIVNGESGEVVDWNADIMVQKASELLSDSNKYERYKKNGLEIAGKFEKKSAIKNYADKLKNLI